MDHRDVDGFRHERQGVHDAFRACFARSEPREPCLRSLVGPFRALARHALEPIARRGEGGHGRARPRCLRAVAGDEAQRRRRSPRLVDDERGDPEGVLICEESSVPNQGHDAVGVARPYGGALGTVDKGQVGVGAASASRQG